MGSALGYTFHLSGGDVYYGDGSSYNAQGVHLACPLPLDVGVRGQEWPLLIAIVVCHDGVCVVRQELQLGPNAGAHGGGDALLCQHPSRAGTAGCLRFLNAYNCRFADLGLVAMCHAV